MIKWPGRRASATRASARQRLEAESSLQTGLRLLVAATLYPIIELESAHEPTALFPSSAVRLIQPMPTTAARYGPRGTTDTRQNLASATTYLHDFQVQFGDDLRLALAALNASGHAVERFQRALLPTWRLSSSATDHY